MFPVHLSSPLSSRRSICARNVAVVPSKPMTSMRACSNPRWWSDTRYVSVPFTLSFNSPKSKVNPRMEARMGLPPGPRR
jgi:hypothetical protein